MEAALGFLLPPFPCAGIHMHAATSGRPDLGSQACEARVLLTEASP